MNSIEASLLARPRAAGALLLAVGALACLCAPASAGTFAQDITELAKADSGPAFNEDQDGFDKHADIFYYQDNNVAREFARSNYLATQVTLAGQAPDQTERPVKPATNPFAVAQRTFKNFGTLQDRWDVKDNGPKGVQYFGLFHGKGSDYVVNKVRAHLLRELANALEDQVPMLDRTAHEDADEEHPELVSEIQDNFRATVERVFREVDDDIRRSMPDKDDSRASATVVIVSANYVTTVSAGKGQVISYGEDCVPSILVDETSDGSREYENHLFGHRKTRHESILPRVQFFSRLSDETPSPKGAHQFLLIETPSVASTVPIKTAVETVLRSIQLNGNDRPREQELYSSAVQNIIEEVARTLGAFHRIFLHSDYSVFLVGLTDKYEDIH